MISHLAHVPIFRMAVFMVGDCSCHEAMDAIYRLKGKRTRVDFSHGPSGCVVATGGDVFCYVKDFDDENTVAHELAHVAATIMGVKGIPLCRETEEVLAYLSGWLKTGVLNQVYSKRTKAMQETP